MRWAPAFAFSLLAVRPALAADAVWSPEGSKPGWAGVVATAFVGDGFRFNNPYRLATVLGKGAESVSRTAAYTDLGTAVVLGDPASWAYGLSLRASFALEGVEQGVLTPSVLVVHRWQRWGAYGRAGVAAVLTPDSTWGAEGAAGALWFPWAGLGFAAELVGDLFYGAGTAEVSTPAYPVLSAQGGIWMSYEVFP